MASAYLNPQDDKREKKNLPFRLIFFRFFFRKKKIFDMILCWKKKTSLGVVNVVFKNTQSDSWTRWFIGYYYLLLIASQSQSLPKYTKRENEYRENVHSLWEFFFFWNHLESRRSAKWTQTTFQIINLFENKENRLEWDFPFSCVHQPVNSQQQLKFRYLFDYLVSSQQHEWNGCVHWMSNDRTSH